ncbi:MAG TPA: hypothetical protein VMH00_12440 [Candidatus Limnocylindrales bacterium]|nr:hypothetical protein [Candidatus Limnocylindrales bacterium]
MHHAIRLIEAHPIVASLTVLVAALLLWAGFRIWADIFLDMSHQFFQDTLEDPRIVESIRRTEAKGPSNKQGVVLLALPRFAVAHPVATAMVVIAGAISLWGGATALVSAWAESAERKYRHSLQNPPSTEALQAAQKRALLEANPHLRPEDLPETAGASKDKA